MSSGKVHLIHGMILGHDASRFKLVFFNQHKPNLHLPHCCSRSKKVGEKKHKGARTRDHLTLGEKINFREFVHDTRHGRCRPKDDPDTVESLTKGDIQNGTFRDAESL